MRQRGALGVARVLQQTTGGGDRGIESVAAVTAQIARAELAGEQARRGVALEIPRRLAAHTAPFRQQLGVRERLAHQQLGGVDAREFIRDGRGVIELHRRETAAAEVEPGETVAAVVMMQRGEQVVAALVEQGFLGERAGRDDAHHLPFDRTFRFRRVADLFAERHRLAGLHQLGEISFHGVKRHAGHRDRFARRLAARGERDVEQRGGAARVVEE